MCSPYPCLPDVILRERSDRRIPLKERMEVACRFKRQDGRGKTGGAVVECGVLSV
jgi:hypothetical protein